MIGILGYFHQPVSRLFLVRVSDVPIAACHAQRGGRQMTAGYPSLSDARHEG